VLGAEPHEKLIRLEMLVSPEDLVEQGAALGRELQAPPFEVLTEDLELAFFDGHLRSRRMGLRLCLN
jgi:hypothetical protein